MVDGTQRRPSLEPAKAKTRRKEWVRGPGPVAASTGPGDVRRQIPSVPLGTSDPLQVAWQVLVPHRKPLLMYPPISTP